MAEQMEGFVSLSPWHIFHNPGIFIYSPLTLIQHGHFRLIWNQLWEACESSGKRALSARQMITLGLQFCSQLDFHHSIEEQHIFPVLAKRMPEFRKELELLSQHRQIHAGLEKLEKYLEQCRSGEEDIRREEVKRLMEGFGKVLWTHLDQEVQTLGAANMRKFWSLAEMRQLPM
jgi:hemerythrin-like domain-containing protein